MWRPMYSGIGKEKDAMLLVTACSLFVVVVTSLVFFLVQRMANKLKDLPPGPRGLPLLGYLPFLGPDLHKDFTKLAGVYGPIYKLWMGNQLCIVVNTPELVKAVVRDHDVTCANRDATVAARIASLGAQDITWRDYGPEWTKLRKIFVRDMMGKAILDDLYVLRKQQVHKSISQIYADVGKPVDIGNLAFLTAFKSIMSMMLGDSLGDGIASCDGTHIKNTAGELMFLLGKANVSDLIPSLAWLDLQGVKKDTERVTRVFENLLDSVIQQRKTDMLTTSKDKGNGRKEYVQFLLELHEKNEDGESSITLTQLKGLLLDTIVGGIDTTSTTVDWAMAELLKHPEVMKNVQEELLKVVGSDNMVEECHVSQLIYLDAVMKETLRLHPPLPLAGPRTSNRATIIGGYKIPQGTRIFLNVGLIQRDPNIWEKPLEFRPERFLDSINAGKFDYLGNNFSFLPFGSGRRVCPGISLADRMGKYMVASFLHSFEWTLPVGANLDMSDKFGIVVKLKEPVVAIPTPRFSNSILYQ